MTAFAFSHSLYDPSDGGNVPLVSLLNIRLFLCSRCVHVVSFSGEQESSRKKGSSKCVCVDLAFLQLSTSEKTQAAQVDQSQAPHGVFAT